jgi:diadenosine tetraphosphate (Ap4A) HIT family hydrolase
MTDVIYEDPWVRVLVPQKNAAVAGHLKVQSKLSATELIDLSDEEVEHFFFVASYAGTALFELLGVQGTNMLLTEKNGPLVIDILARRENDGVQVLWSPKQLPQNELQSSAKSIKDAYDILVWHEQKKDEKPAPKLKEPEQKKIPQDNYLIKHLRRVP